MIQGTLPSQAAPEPHLKEEKIPSTDGLTIIAHSGDMDKLMAGLILATGAAASGKNVTVYFTFWGLAALRKKRVYKKKNLVERMLSFCLPSGPKEAPSSRMNMLGIGPKMFQSLMRRHNIAELRDMIQTSQDLGVTFMACSMSMDLMGIRADELIDGISFGGVAAYLGEATKSHLNLFI